MTAKRFLVFAYDRYYPAGGWQDLYGQEHDFDGAVALAREAVGEWTKREDEAGYRGGRDYADVVDLQDQVVISFERIRQS